MCTHNQSFEQQKKNITNFHLKIIIFTAMKNCNVLHRHVFVMVESFQLPGLHPKVKLNIQTFFMRIKQYTIIKLSCFRSHFIEMLLLN